MRENWLIKAALSAFLLLGVLPALLPALSGAARAELSPPLSANVLDLALYVCVTVWLIVNVWRRPPALTEDRRIATWMLCLASYSYFLAFEPGQAFVWIVGLHLLGDSSLLYLGRSFAVLPARRQIKSGWLYRWVRHPAYASYMLTDLAYCIALPTPRNFLVTLVGAGLLVTRARLEEHVLVFDPAYRAYQLRTRWRFFPGLY